MRIRPDSAAFVLLLASLSALPALSTDMALPALAAIGLDLHVPPSSAALTLSLFLAGFAIAPLAYGPLADRYGRRPIVLFGGVLFSLASAACALAPSLASLLVFRVLQGVGAGAGSVMALTIVRDLFQGHIARARLSYVASMRIVAPMIAPTLGSWVMYFAGWRSIYGVMALAGVATTLAVYLGMAETRPADAAPVRISVGALLRTYARVLSNPVLLGNTLVNALTFGCQFAYITGSPLLMMQLLGMSPQAFGAVFAMTAFGIMAASLINGRLNARGIAPHKLLWTGLILSSSTSVLLAVLGFADALSAWSLVPLLMLNTFSFGMIAPNASHAAVEPLPEVAGVASAVVSCVMMAVGALSGSLVTMLYDGHSARAITGIMAVCTLSALSLYAFWVRRLPAAAHRRA
ncbi:multidrug effflux MFS transporter [Pigmentiphaga sp. GD03639]|uniref:multidrug effflux MFS transporter n=1 Tax=Pigmentiphaga sp. GD03639 TaxID=2975354 RepID=UPI0024471689|nr:multidrug effflux MFS transporter [Pigmentiphaga sp. GD03639]MDH2236507.1 multidrug effflux MFS transporter [Pigmentiphaga sp. GD03639]